MAKLGVLLLLLPKRRPVASAASADSQRHSFPQLTGRGWSGHLHRSTNEASARSARLSGWVPVARPPNGYQRPRQAIGVVPGQRNLCTTRRTPRTRRTLDPRCSIRRARRGEGAIQ